jgi:hypothetical protein
VFLGFVELAATVFVEIICVKVDYFTDSILPPITFTLVHALIGGSAVIFMRPHREPEHYSFDKLAVDQNNSEPNVRQASDGEDDVRFAYTDE